MKLMFMPTINTKHLETIIHTFLSTCHALLQGNDVFHYHALGPTTLAWLPRLFGCKVVTTVQGLDWERAKWGPVARAYLKFGEWTTVKFPHATIVVSRTLAQHYAVKYQKSTIHIPNGFEPPIQRCPSLIKDLDLDQDNYILFVGRLSPEKGCHTLIHAFRQVETDKHLVLAGRANYDDDYYQQLRAEANGSAKIHFVGFVQGAMLQELYSNAYLVVHPSECEGLSVSLLEALSYNHCVLVSNIPENVEVLPARGYTFQVGNQRDLAQQLQKLFDNPGQVVSSRRFIQAHTDNLWPWEKVGQATYEVYEALLN
jgi:glycosyltransferase involved in cell wall biosynthesis